jgi:NAD(P)-dependent dehydrogenase (short-subunit alcohol dehydrogenase family)
MGTNIDYWKDKVALITGAGSGIGRALAAGLTRRGAFVLATDVNAATATATVQAGEAAEAAPLDVRDEQAFKRVVTDLVRTKGRIDFLINNAGLGAVGEAYEFTRAHWDLTFDVNVGGTVNGVLAAYPQMVKQRSGHIVNVASLAGLGSVPFFTAYSASKHAVVGLTVSLRAEAADLGVRVSAICPAAIDTPLLDNMNPSQLPKTTWQPDVRRYLTQLAGAPYPVTACAEDALRAVERNEAIIVIPLRGRIAWRIGRYLPALVDKLTLRAARDERRHRR